MPTLENILPPHSSQLDQFNMLEIRNLYSTVPLQFNKILPHWKPIDWANLAFAGQYKPPSSCPQN
jgi:hypothetical protein